MRARAAVRARDLLPRVVSPRVPFQGGLWLVFCFCWTAFRRKTAVRICVSGHVRKRGLVQPVGYSRFDVLFAMNVRIRVMLCKVLTLSLLHRRPQVALHVGSTSQTSEIHARFGNARALSYTAYTLYNMYCLRHTRPTHLYGKGASAMLSASGLAS